MTALKLNLNLRDKKKDGILNLGPNINHVQTSETKSVFYPKSLIH